jgi:hypothetical protein
LGMLKCSAIILDAIWRPFLTKSATTAMFTSVRVDFGRPPLSSSTSSLPSRNREYRIQIEYNWPILCTELNHSFIWYAGSYVFRHPCAIFMELLMSLWVTWKLKCLCCLSYAVNVGGLCAHSQYWSTGQLHSIKQCTVCTLSLNHLKMFDRFRT